MSATATSYVFYLDHDDPGSYWGFEDPEGYGEAPDFQVRAHSLEEAERALAAHLVEAPWRVKWLPPFSHEDDYRAWSQTTWRRHRRAGR